MSALNFNIAANEPESLEELNASSTPAPRSNAWNGHGQRPANAALSSSFGAQAAVMLHMLTQQQADIPVILIDTGYLFPETYRFADELQEPLKLNLQVFRPLVSRAWMEARHGRLWENGMDGIDQYNDLRKVEPMKRALSELGVDTWFAGMRRNQASTRRKIRLSKARRPLEGAPDRRLDRPRHLRLPAQGRPAVPPAVGTKGMSPSATGTRRARWPRLAMPKPRGSSA